MTNEFDLEDTSIRIQTYTVDDVEYKLTQTDPYGFVYITKKGSIPNDLQGSFTSPYEAKKKIDGYHNWKRVNDGTTQKPNGS